MATYELTSPKGEKFRVTAPDDATEQQVMDYFHSQTAGQETPQFDEAKRRGLVAGTAAEKSEASPEPTAAEMPHGIDRIKQAAKQTADYLTAPINPDLPATEKAAQSFGRIAPVALAVAPAQMAYNAAKKFTDPVVNAISGKQNLVDAAGDLLNAPTNAITELVEGFARFKGEPLGLYGADAMSKAWDDPAMAILSILPEAYKTLGVARKVAKDINAKGLPFTEANAKYTAAKIIKEAYSDSPEFAPTSAANQAAIAKNPQAGTLTQAQKTGSLKAGSFEQSAATLSPELGENLKIREAQAQNVAKQEFVKSLGPDKAMPTPDLADIYGQGIMESIGKAKEPVKVEIERLKGEIPQNYRLDVSPLVNAVNELAGRTDTTPAERAAVKEVISEVNSKITGNTGKMGEIISIQRAIGDAINKASGSSAEPLLMSLKAKIQESLNAFSGRVGKGEKVDYKGQVYDTGVLSSELAKNTLEISKLRADSILDIPAMREGLKKAGQDFGLDQVVGETAKSYQDRLAADYKKKVDPELPTKQDPGTAKKLANLETRNQTISGILQTANPALDAAAKYKAFNDFYSQHYAERFKRGAVDRATRKGNEATGTATKAENIGRQFDNLSGANDLIKAVTAPEAKDKMRPYYQDQITSKFTTKTGLNVPGAVEWLDKNRQVLDRYGLTQEMAEMIKGQTPEYFRQLLETKRPDILGNSAATAAEIRKMMTGNIKTFRRLYAKDPAPIRKGLEFLRLVEAQGRNKSVSYAGNSTSLEKMIGTGKIMNGAGLLPKIVDGLGDVLAGGAIGFAAGGGTGATAGAVAGRGVGIAYKVAKEHQGQIVLKIINEAILDPTGKGADLIDFARNPTAKNTTKIKDLIVPLAKQPEEENQ